ncbi:MAG: hypothetical protein AAF573_20045, partial [Bacteroidota bacterium]
FTYNVFDQVTDTINLIGNIAEENYLYLHNIHKSDSLVGRAVYFNTFHLLNEKYYVKYLNHPTKIFSGLIKQLKIGYWVKTSKDTNEISLYFRNEFQKKKLISSSSNPYKKRSQRLISFKGEIKDVPSPSGSDKLFIMKKSSTVSTAIPYELLDNDSVKNTIHTPSDLNKFFLYLDIKRVFDLKYKKGLYFCQVAENRNLVLEEFERRKQEKDNLSPKITKIIWGESTSKKSKKKGITLFFETEDGQLHRFQRKPKAKTKRDQKYYSILNLKIQPNPK